MAFEKKSYGGSAERKPAGDRGDRKGAAGGRRVFFKRRKTCPFKGENINRIDYKDVRLLSRYISERG
ncbi:MAG: hypothetical protein KGQ70_07925, partial [Alphaproteobacteria bacterium]|nr:hypothetical protein [Alphaproteobacteria bacterium]